MLAIRTTLASSVAWCALFAGGSAYAQTQAAPPLDDTTPTAAQAQSDPATTSGPASAPGPVGSAAAQTGSQVEASASSEGASSNALQDIVVTAQKRSENAQRVPIAISTVNAGALTASAVYRVADLGRAVPALKLLDIGGQITPRIRGIGTTSVAPGTEAPVGVFIDGVYYASTADIGADLSDVAQVSVLKGPQGTLFGRNATGGVIQITTRDPTKNTEVSLGSGIDNYLTWRSDAFVGGSLASNLLGSLSAQAVKQYDGWGKNIYNGKDVHRIDGNYQFRGKLIYEPTSSTTIRLSADYARRRGSQAGDYTTPVGFPQAFASPLPKRKWSINSYIQPEYRYHGGGGSVTIDQDVGFAKLTSITAYRRSDLFWQFNPSATAVPALNVDLTDRARQFTQELQLVSRANSRFTWAVGAFYFHQRALQDPGNLYFNPAYRAREGGFIAGFSQFILNDQQKLDSLAGFAQTTLAVTDSTRVTAGIRYTWEKKTLHESEDGILAVAPVTVPLIPSETVSESEKRPTWRLSIDQDLGPKTIAYVSYNRGYKSGGFNTRDITNPPFKAETLDAYEVGLKSQFLDNKVRLNVGAFYYDYKNIQVAKYAFVSVIYNGARSHLYGLDVDVDARPTDRLSIDAGLSYLHSEFTNFPQAQTTSYVPTAGGALITVFNASAKGNSLPFSPRFSYTLGATYTVPSEIGPFAFNATDAYSSRYYPEVDNKVSQKAYHLLNASLAWTSPDKRYGVRLFTSNLLNKQIMVQASSNDSGYNADFPIAPRTYGVRLELNY